MMAEDMIEGHCCSGCGLYFKEAHGYPVLCNLCWVSWTKKERKGLQKATIPELGHDRNHSHSQDNH